MTRDLVETKPAQVSHGSTRLPPAPTPISCGSRRAPDPQAVQPHRPAGTIAIDEPRLAHSPAPPPSENVSDARSNTPKTRSQSYRNKLALRKCVAIRARSEPSTVD